MENKEFTIEQIMTVDVETMDETASMSDVHRMMKLKNIRHIPVVTDNKIFGVVTQKAVLSRVMLIIEQFGSKALEDKEKEVNIIELVDKDVLFVPPTMPVIQGAEFFINNRHGCLPVVGEDNQLLGILTSSDFVKLAIKLLG